MLAVAGCQSGDGASKLGAGVGATSNPSEEKISVSELRMYCPAVTLREGTAYFNTYAKGGQGDALKIIYQASIADVTRSCKPGGGTTTINVAVAGRVVPGPAGAPGTITMPIRVAVLRGSEVLYSQLHQHQVTVGTDATQFVFNDPNVVIPADSGPVQVFAGYDEGPPAKKAKSE